MRVGNNKIAKLVELRLIYNECLDQYIQFSYSQRLHNVFHQNVECKFSYLKLSSLMGGMLSNVFSAYYNEQHYWLTIALQHAIPLKMGKQKGRFSCGRRALNRGHCAVLGVGFALPLSVFRPFLFGMCRLGTD